MSVLFFEMSSLFPSPWAPSGSVTSSLPLFFLRASGDLRPAFLSRCVAPMALRPPLTIPFTPRAHFCSFFCEWFRPTSLPVFSFGKNPPSNSPVVNGNSLPALPQCPISLFSFFPFQSSLQSLSFWMRRPLVHQLRPTECSVISPVSVMPLVLSIAFHFFSSKCLPRCVSIWVGESCFFYSFFS